MARVFTILLRLLEIIVEYLMVFTLLGSFCVYFFSESFSALVVLTAVRASGLTTNLNEGHCPQI